MWVSWFLRSIKGRTSLLPFLYIPACSWDPLALLWWTEKFKKQAIAVEAAGKLLLDGGVSVASGLIDSSWSKSSKMERLSQLESSEKFGVSEEWWKLAEDSERLLQKMLQSVKNSAHLERITVLILFILAKKKPKDKLISNAWGRGMIWYDRPSFKSRDKGTEKEQVSGGRRCQQSRHACVVSMLSAS